MVLPGIFKSKKSSEANLRKNNKGRETSSPSPSRRSVSKSPTKSAKESDPRFQPRKSASRSNSKAIFSADTHPLNLPPDEREKRRSAMSAQSDPPTPMEVDQNGDASSAASTPPPAAPITYPDTDDAADDGDFERTTSPIPPPHRFIPPTPPPPPAPPKPSVDAEACKALGNKYFKNKDYVKAIAEYTKGRQPIFYRPFIGNRWLTVMRITSPRCRATIRHLSLKPCRCFHVREPIRGSSRRFQIGAGAGSPERKSITETVPNIRQPWPAIGGC